jgi:four helix bundle protein
MDEEQFKQRTKNLALGVMRTTASLPTTRELDVLARQLVRSATSIGANYRAACRARSVPDMITKLKIVEEEADETQYWLELISELDRATSSELKSLHRETDEILAMTVASIRTLRARQAKSSIVNRKP